MAQDNHLNRFTMIGVVLVVVLVGLFFGLNRLGGSPDATSAGPVPKVRE